MPVGAKPQEGPESNVAFVPAQDVARRDCMYSAAGLKSVLQAGAY